MRLENLYPVRSAAIQKENTLQPQVYLPVFPEKYRAHHDEPTDGPDATQFVRLALSVDKLHQLLKRRDIRAVDFRCLDCETQDCVRKLLLDASTHFFE